MLRCQALNVLVGNSDGHPKNLSLLYHRDGTIRLAPFYDLICTRAIDRKDANLAFDIRGERNPSLVVYKHWMTLAVQCDVGARFMRTIVTDIAKQLLEHQQSVAETFASEAGDYPAIQRVLQVVEKQCRRALADNA